MSLWKHFLTSEEEQEEREREQENQSVKTKKAPLREGPNEWTSLSGTTFIMFLQSQAP